MSKRSISAMLDLIVTEFQVTRDEGRPVEVQDFLNRNPRLAPVVGSFLLELDRKFSDEVNAGDDAPKLGGEHQSVDQDDQHDLPTLQPAATPGQSAPRQQNSDPYAGTQDYVAGNSASTGRVLFSQSTSPDCCFGHYEIIEEIARGGMGVVYKARHIQLGRVVALKMILAGELAGPEDVRRFQTEAQAAAHLDHPNIVPVFEVGEVHGQHFFTMGFVSGPDLGDFVRREKLSPQRIATIVQQIARAIEYAHSRGVIHRDLKPSNVLIDNDCVPRVTDFGLAKRLEDQSELTRSGEVLGTPGYMAPEQAAGQSGSIGRAADIYAIGAVLYFCLTHRPPFRAATALETLVQILENEPPAPRSLNKSIPEPMERICLRCLERDPKDRYQSASEVAAELGRFLQGQEVMASTPSLLSRIKRFAKRSPAFAAHLTAIGFALALAQVRYLTSDTRTWDLHVMITALLSSWLVFSAIVHLVAQKARGEIWADTFWLCGDAIFLTCLIYLLTSPIHDPAILLVAYPLLVVAGGLFFHVRLVLFVLIVSEIAYVVLQLATREMPRYLHYQICFMVVLALIGACVMHQIRRVRMLSQYFESMNFSTDSLESVGQAKQN